RAEELLAVHRGQDLAGAVYAEDPQRLRVRGHLRQEPVGPVGGDAEFPDPVELLRPGRTYPHGGVFSHPAHPRPERQATYGWPDSLVIGRPAACQPTMPSATLLASQPAPASACAAWSDRMPDRQITYTGRLCSTSV